MGYYVSGWFIVGCNSMAVRDRDVKVEIVKLADRGREG